MSNVLVIGASGFLGSHIADILSEQGHAVTLFDRTPSPWRQECQRTIIGDILDPKGIADAMTGMDVVYHLAGIADIEESASRPADTMAINVLGSANIFEACIRKGVKRVMFASTIYVYSEKGSFYRVSKQAVEAMLEEYARATGLQYTVLRYGSLYGPRSQEWNGLRRYITSALTTGKIVYRGTGRERREYIHVRDAAALSVKAMNPEYANQSLMLTGTQVLTSQELLQFIREILDNQVEIEIDSEHLSSHHYTITPFRYIPKTATKVVSTDFIDIGQGIVELVNDVAASCGVRHKG